MRRRTWPALLAAAGFGAVVGWMLRGAGGGAGDDGTDALPARVDELERENLDLRRRYELARARRRAEPAAETARGRSAPRAEPPGVEPVSRADGALVAPAMRLITPQPAGAGELPTDPYALLEKLRDAVARGDDAAVQAIRLALVAKGRAAADVLLPVVRDPQTPADLAVCILDVLGNLEVPWLSATAEEILRRTDATPALRAAALRSAVTADPSNAGAVVGRLLSSGSDAEVALARDALSQARDRSLLPLLTDEVRRAAGTGHVHGLVNAIARIKDRAWSALQMTGEPDTPVEGDLGTAWASKAEDMGIVWVELDYDREVVPELVRIRETHHPGAVVRIEARRAGGQLDLLWEGSASAAPAPRWFEPNLAEAPAAVKSIRITLDTDKVPGWNEIDAVELVGGGLRQWARGARASSSYSD